MEGVQGVGSPWTGGQCFQLSLPGELRPGSDHILTRNSQYLNKFSKLLLHMRVL